PTLFRPWRDHGRRTVRELVDQFGAYYRPYATADRQRPYPTAELLDRVGLAAQADQQVKTLSGGQRRRLDVAIGLVGRPRLLFLDEPTAGFDPVARRDFHDLVRGLSDLEDTTILLTTHDLAEAERLADRILILDRGRIVADGSAEELARQVAGRTEVRWTAGGRRHVETTEVGTAFVRDLLARLGDDVTDLEVVRTTLEATYLTMVRRSDSRWSAGADQVPAQDARCTPRPTRCGWGCVGAGSSSATRSGPRRTSPTTSSVPASSSSSCGSTAATRSRARGWSSRCSSSPACWPSPRCSPPPTGWRRRWRPSGRTARCCGPSPSRTGCAATSPARPCGPAWRSRSTSSCCRCPPHWSSQGCGRPWGPATSPCSSPSSCSASSPACRSASSSARSSATRAVWAAGGCSSWPVSSSSPGCSCPSRRCRGGHRSSASSPRCTGWAWDCGRRCCPTPSSPSRWGRAGARWRPSPRSACGRWWGCCSRPCCCAGWRAASPARSSRPPGRS